MHPLPRSSIFTTLYHPCTARCITCTTLPASSWSDDLQLHQLLSSMSSSSSCSPSSSSSSFTHTALAVPTSHDLSHLLNGANPARLLAAIEDEEQTLRRLHALLVQEQKKLQEEEKLLREKIDQHPDSRQRPPHESVAEDEYEEDEDIDPDDN